MRLFSCPIQAEGNSQKRAAVLVQQRINFWESCSIADKTKGITGFRNSIDNVAEPAVQGRLATGKTQLINTTAFTFTKHLIQNFQR